MVDDVQQHDNADGPTYIVFKSTDALGNPVSVTVMTKRYTLISGVGIRLSRPMKPCYEDGKARCPIEELKKNG